MQSRFQLSACLAAMMINASTAWASTPASPGTTASTASEWREFHGVYYRLDEDGDLSCYSEDGINCRSGVPSSDPNPMQTLSCGVSHQVKWGSTGYDTPGHWCNTAHANLFATWNDYEILGHAALLSTNANGDPMCRSLDGVQCLWGADRHRPVAEGRIVPVVCGRAHQRDWHITGYEPGQPITGASPGRSSNSAPTRQAFGRWRRSASNLPPSGPRWKNRSRRPEYVSPWTAQRRTAQAGLGGRFA